MRPPASGIPCNCYRRHPKCDENSGSAIVISTAAAPPRAPTDYAIIFGRGEVAEWSKAPDSKSGIRQRIVGSNPTLSAIIPPIARLLSRTARCRTESSDSSPWPVRATVHPRPGEAYAEGQRRVKLTPSRFSGGVGAGTCLCGSHHGEVDERLKSHAWKACLG